MELRVTLVGEVLHQALHNALVRLEAVGERHLIFRLPAGCPREGLLGLCEPFGGRRMGIIR